VILVGSPNVGKSQLFNRLTGRYVTVSNYPGTTVEVARGRVRAAGGSWELVDTPGIYALNAITAEEQVTFDFLFGHEVRAVVHVVDAKNLERMLPLTLQLAEAGLPLLLALNMADEAADLGFRIDVGKLRDLLGLPVVRTVATRGSGLKRLLRLLPEVRRGAPLTLDYGAPIDGALAELAPLLAPACDGRFSVRALALLLLQSDEAVGARLLRALAPTRAAAAWQAVAAVQRRLPHGAHCHIAIALKRRAAGILATAVRFPPPRESAFRERLSRALMRPLIGVPVLLAVLYFGLYQFVGVLGAGTLVDALSEAFGRWIMPGAERVLRALLPWSAARELFVGEYGIVPLGLRYALAIVMPIVGTFFLAFSLLEDSGYLPRLAMMIDRVFKRIGLNGRAVIPLVLGFGCGTMATMVTRTLESRRERIIATFLLALAVPCSAQMGVIMGLLARHPGGLVAWIVFVAAIFLFSGWLAARVEPRPELAGPDWRLPRRGAERAPVVGQQRPSQRLQGGGGLCGRCHVVRFPALASARGLVSLSAGHVSATAEKRTQTG
jgi:ferrous iron transport protein B